MSLYATMFDANFLLRGVACVRSLARHAQAPLRMLVLALDDSCAQVVHTVVGPLPEAVSLDVIGLDEIETRWPALREARGNRSRIEYYFTLTPFLCHAAISRLQPGERAVYVDADLYFFSDPEAAFAGTPDAPIIVTEHRFPPRLAHLSESYGRFNVGWLAFDGSDTAQRCVERWSDDCLAACTDAPADGRFADQKYLDAWPTQVPGLGIADDPGLNAAPWNVEGRRIDRVDGVPRIDGQPLIAYHFHRVQRLAAHLHETDFDGFGRLSAPLLRYVYAPYLAELCSLEDEHGARLPAATRSELTRFDPSAMSLPRRLHHRLSRLLRTLRRERVLFRDDAPIAPFMATLHG